MKLTKIKLINIIREEIQNLSERVDPWVRDSLNLRPDQLVSIANSELGWAMAEQLEDILNGEALSKQNRNALEYIQQFAEEQGEDFLSAALHEYLNRGTIEYLHEFE